jgi:hypothetical protein
MGIGGFEIGAHDLGGSIFDLLEHCFTLQLFVEFLCLCEFTCLVFKGGGQVGIFLTGVVEFELDGWRLLVCRKW